MAATSSALVVASLAACNFLIDTDSAQCSTDGDCSARFPDSARLVCRAGTCTADGVVDAGDAGPAVDAAPECVSNKECMDRELAKSGKPAICAKGPTPKCQPLELSGVCLSRVLPLDAEADLNDDNVVILGGFAPVKNNPLADPTIRSYGLALKEIHDYGGLPNGPNGKRRPVVMALCGSEVELAERGVDHLVKDLKVPALLARFSPIDMPKYVTNVAVPNGVFTVNPNDTPPSLKYQDVKRLAWHLLGTPEDLALTYAPLVKRMEKEARTRWSIAAGDPIKVALVTSTFPREKSIADTIKEGPIDPSPDAATPRNREAGAVSFNGKYTAENQADLNFAFEQFDSTELGGKPDYGGIVSRLAAFHPDIVIAATTAAELDSIVKPLEDLIDPDSGTGARHPLWALSVANAHSPNLLQYLFDKKVSRSTYTRFVGVQYAGSVDPAPRTAWLNRMLALYGADAGVDSTAYEATENPYDAVYWATFGLYAAGPGATLTGGAMAEGARKLLRGPRVFPGDPEVLRQAFAAMQLGDVTFIGALGERDIDPGTGTQFGYGAMYCYRQDGIATKVDYDQLRYNRQTRTLDGSTLCPFAVP